MIQISKTDLLDLYDNKKSGFSKRKINDETIGSHASALTGVIGEDLVLGLFQHYWDNKHTAGKGKSDVLSYHCRQENGQQKLDAWIECFDTEGMSTLYQTEVKNWSTFSRVKNYSLAPNATDEEVKLRAQEQWTAILDDKRNLSAVKKVSFQSRISELGDDYTNRNDESVPLLCMWQPLATSNSKLEPFFRVSAPEPFSRET
ncbi:MAG: hypothetical protein P1U69_08065 [Parvibaculaceae bacterium]|nr:hypothetical protein [Parvibaculaceae bacterium]|tara:strand:+ start:705 stop:1310 length:606 start_codon:yes stop_codon:yes gene_type:complete